MSIEIEIVTGRVMSIPVPVTAVDIPILPGDGYLVGWSLRDAQAETTADVEGSVTAPTAGQTIATTGTIPAGEYTITWTASLNGAAAAAEVDNFELLVGATVVAQSVNPGAAGNYPQPPVVYDILTPSTVSVKAVGAGTAAVVYSADISLSPASAMATMIELRDGNRASYPASMAPNDNDTRSFGSEGVKIYTGLTLHVIQGAVTGAVLCRFRQAS